MPQSSVMSRMVILSSGFFSIIFFSDASNAFLVMLVIGGLLRQTWLRPLYHKPPRRAIARSVMPAPLALSQFFLRTKGGACKNWSAAPGCRYPNWRRARSALANLDGCPCSSSAVSAAGSASLTQPLTAPCFVRWTRSLFVPPHAGEPPLSGASRQLSRGERQVHAPGWRLTRGEANFRRPP